MTMVTFHLAARFSSLSLPSLLPLSSLNSRFCFANQVFKQQRLAFSSRVVDKILVNAELIQSLLKNHNNYNNNSSNNSNNDNNNNDNNNDHNNNNNNNNTETGTQLSADSLQVRLVVDHGGGQRDPMTIVTLAQAMQLSADLNLDLIGVQLKLDIPVIRAQSIQKLQYKEKTKATANQTKALPLKEIKFKAGIADHDLERKSLQIIAYLEKGHRCQLTLQASKFKLTNDENIITTTIQRVMDIVGNKGELTGTMKSSREGCMMTITMIPPSKEKSKKKESSQQPSPSPSLSH